MNIPRAFEKSLASAYVGEITLDKFLQENRPYLTRLARYALRYATEWMVSEEEDLVQEASIACVRALWDWDDSRGIGLAKYVLYQIGIHLQSVVIKEKRKRRHPSSPGVRKIQITENTFGTTNHLIDQVAIHEAWDKVGFYERISFLKAIEENRKAKKLLQIPGIQELYDASNG